MDKSGNIKILATIPSGFCFGLQHITVDLFKNLPDHIESHFILTKWNNNEMATLLKKSNIPFSYSWLGMFSRKLDILNIKMSFNTLRKLPKLYYDFLKIQKRYGPDILYFANHHEIILLYPVLLFSKKTIVCHMHDPSPAIPFQKRIFKKYNKVVDHYIAISDNVNKRTVALGCDPLKITTIHNGISIPDTINIKQKNEWIGKMGWPSDSILIGITGQMTEKKGHLDLLHAFHIAFRNNNKIRLVIGGKMEDPFFTKLQSEINLLNLQHAVYFSGWQNEVSAFFQKIDVFVLASLHEEGYGLVVAEAMAHKVPVVITNSGGAVEIVEDKISGFIVNKGDVNDMADKILLLANDNVLRQSISANAYTRVTTLFNLSTQAKVLSDFFHKVSKKNVREY